MTSGEDLVAVQDAQIHLPRLDIAREVGALHPAPFRVGPHGISARRAPG